MTRTRTAEVWLDAQGVLHVQQQAVDERRAHLAARLEERGMTEKIQTRTSVVWLDEDGIVRCSDGPGCELSAGDALENYAATAQAGGGVARPLMVDIRRVKSVSKEAREVYSRPGNVAVTSALALVIGSPLSRVIGNFFIGLNKTAMPTRLFTREEDAVVWLRTFLRSAQLG